jgi:hypothetical protein
MNARQLATAGLTGAAAGVLGGAVFGAVGRSMGLLKPTALLCTLTYSQVAGYTLGNALAGSATGMTVDAVLQGAEMAGNPQQQWSWGRFTAAGMVGFAGGAAGYLAARALAATCFSGRMWVDTPEGRKRISEFREGDLLYSRDEGDPDGPIVVKRVLKVHVRVGRVFLVRLGGQTLETTAEHPFWVVGRGWVIAAELREGDRLAGRSGAGAVVEGVEQTDRWETLYNLHVADYHTYFVGDISWGFSVWAHNTYGDPKEYNSLRKRLANVDGDARKILYEIGAQEGVDGTAWARSWKDPRGKSSGPRRVAELEQLKGQDAIDYVLREADRLGVPVPERLRPRQGWEPIDPEYAERVRLYTCKYTEETLAQLEAEAPRMPGEMGLFRCVRCQRGIQPGDPQWVAHEPPVSDFHRQTGRNTTQEVRNNYIQENAVGYSHATCEQSQGGQSQGAYGLPVGPNFKYPRPRPRGE